MAWWQKCKYILAKYLLIEHGDNKHPEVVMKNKSGETTGSVKSIQLYANLNQE